MKKILFVSTVILYPINAGNRVRITNLINIMRDMNYDVYYVHYGHSSNLLKRKMNEYFGKNHCWFYDKQADSLVKKIHDRQRMLDKSKSVYYSVDELIPKGFMGYLKRLQKDNSFDIVIAEYVTSSKVLTAFEKNVLKIIDTHDILTNRNKIFEQLKQNPTGVYLKKRQEIKGLKRADVLLAIQDKEAKVFKKWLPNKKVYMIGNQVKIFSPHVTENRNVLFVGSKNLLNKIAAEFCIENLSPILEQNGGKLLMAGGVCDYFSNDAKCEKMGYVQELSVLYKDVRAVVNPIQGGTGLNIKSIEALGFAKPLITTKVGAKGLPKEVLAIADDVEEFQKRVVQIINDDEIVSQMSLSAYEFATHYNEVCRNNLEKALNTKKKDEKDPTITVITVCKNAEKNIEKTINSVLKQNYDKVEYLIIDGLSSDRTIEIVNKYSDDKRIKLFSEGDTGIYNAMNKGVRYAAGQYIIFLNSGDELIGKDILSEMASVIRSKRADMVSGNWIKQYDRKKQYVCYSQNSMMRIILSALFFYFMANHQSILVKKKYLAENPFDESFKISADFLWYLKMLKKIVWGKLKFVVLDRFIVNYKMDGISAQKRNYETMMKECHRAVAQEFGFAKGWHDFIVKIISPEFLWKYVHAKSE